MSAPTQSPTPEQTKLMDIPELAELLGISKRALYMRARRKAVPGIVYIPSGSGRNPRIRFSRKVIGAWLAARDTDPYANETDRNDEGSGS